MEEWWTACWSGQSFLEKSYLATWESAMTGCMPVVGSSLWRPWSLSDDKERWVWNLWDSGGQDEFDFSTLMELPSWAHWPCWEHSLAVAVRFVTINLWWTPWPRKQLEWLWISGITSPGVWGWKVVTWLILPVVICLSQRLSHACLSINKLILWNCEWLIKSVIVYLMIPCYMDNCGNSRANTCNQAPTSGRGVFIR